MPFTKEKKEENLQSFLETKHVLLETTKRDLREVGPDLIKFVKLIEKEKPEAIVFLDKSARIFATPIKKYLEESSGTAPEMYFFNDTIAKFYFTKPSFQEEVRKFYPNTEAMLKKKIIFFDETYSQGLGASIIQKISQGKADWKYFALTFDPQGMVSPRYDDDTLDEIDLRLEQMREQKKLHIYKNIKQNLFSRYAAKLYVDEPQLTTKRLLKQEMEAEPFSLHPTNPSIKIPNALWSPYEEERNLFAEGEGELQKEKMGTVKEIKDLIFQKLKHPKGA